MEALKVTAEKLEGTSGESQEQLSNAFQIAANLRRLLEDRESQFATLEGNCRRRELELEEIQRKLAEANSTFTETVESRDMRIRELEHLLALKQAEVQEAQEELRDLQGALDVKDSHVRRLEYEMKLKSERESQRTKTFVSTMSSWSSSASQVDGVAGYRSSMHSMQLESMRHVYMQNSPVQQMPSQDECVSGYGLSSIKLQEKPSSAYLKDRANLQELQTDSCLELRGDEKSLQSHNSGSGPQDYYQETERLLYASGRAEGTERLSNCGSSPCATYGGHNYINGDRESPKAHTGLSEASKRAIAAQDSMYSGCDSLKERNAESISLAVAPTHGPLQASHTVVDSLHDEIQQLQARIMSRLRDAPSQQESWRGGNSDWT
eukprot:Gb_23828 [translate_table: standard]